MAQVTITRGGDGTFIVSGPLQFATVGLARGKVERFLSAGSSSPLTFDLGNVTHSDSAGLALLIDWMREARRREVQVQFRNVPSQMMAVAAASGLDHLLP